MEQRLYKLPEEWEWKSLLDVSRIGAERGFMPEIVNGQVPFVGMANIDQSSGLCSSHEMRDFAKVKKGYTKFQKGAVLLAKITPCTENNKTALIADLEGGYATTEVYPIHSAKQIYSQYLLQFLRSPSIRELLISKMEGATGRKRVPLQAVKNIQIPIPPIDEQQRIITKLNGLFTRIDTAINHLQDNLKLSKDLFASVLKSKVSDERHDCSFRSLNSLGQFSGGGTPSKNKSEYWDGNILWITPKDMKALELKDSKQKITHLGVRESSAKLIPKNSVLIVARSGILRHTLPVCINRVEATVNQDIKVFIPGKDVSPKYMQYLLIGYEAFILSQLVKGGVTVESLKYKEFQNFKFPIPSLTDQYHIVNYLDELSKRIHAIETATQKKLRDLEALKSSLLNNAFRGQL